MCIITTSLGYTAKNPHFTNNLYAENGDITTNTFTIVTRKSMFPVLFDANFRDKQIANVSAHWLKPSGPSDPSAMSVGSSIDKNGDGKPISTISALTANAADITNTTIDTHTNNTIYRLHADTWACRNCKIRADIHFMQKHDCSGKK